MGMNMVTNRFVFRVVELPMMATGAIYVKTAPIHVEKAWTQVKSDLAGLSSLIGLKLGTIDARSVALGGRLRDAGGEGPGRLKFDVGLHHFSVEVWVYYPGGSPGAESLAKVSVPREVEPYREFLTRLSGWSLGGKKLVTDADLKKFAEEFPPKPTVHKNYAEMAKKSKEDVAAFRAWAKKNSKAAKAFVDLDKSAKLKPDDPARATALKAIDAALKDYYASF